MAAKAKSGTLSFTPTEELILEVLQARIRLGEDIWTFDSRLGPSVAKLEAKGLVGSKAGIVEHTVLVWPTSDGKILLFSGKFHERLGSKKLANRQKELRREAKILAKRKAKKA